MRYKILFLVLLLPTVVLGQKVGKHSVLKDHLAIQLADGSLTIYPLSESAIRVKFEKGGVKEEQELILTQKQPIPNFKVSEKGDQLRLITKQITVLVDKKTGRLDFADNTGKLFLSEKAGSRKLEPGKVMGEACFLAEQSFDSPENEFLFGLGQFQDGHYNLRNISRKLIQVNSQIAIPFLYSSRGYGILWHQYGLTDFNPADNFIPLTKSTEASADKKEVEVTTTSGTQKVTQQQALYTGTFTLAQAGEYSLMLDLGDMDSRHLVVIDGKPLIDQTNIWLPTAASALVKLTAGEHSVQVICKSTNTPKLSWKLTDDATTFRSPHAKALDYVVFRGNDADEVISSYRKLSGQVPMLPLWAYGFWQCRERYTSGNHLVETVQEFRHRNLPLDVIVQDWQYWGKHGWGVPKFDETHYPNPDQFIDKLHNLNARFAISVWENLDKNSVVTKEYLDKNLFIPDSKWIDIFKPETQETHWHTLNKNLFTHGVDAWWMDATEPENDALTGTQTFLGPGEFYRLTYPLFVSKAVYDGQRKTNPDKRVTILTRSAFAGQQRYGTINWSGDINGTWDGYKRQIVAGANYSLTGMPFWTTDIGGFFRPGSAQYTDANYRELLTRWFQWGAFNTIFRIHGYQSETEPWKYGTEVEENMRKMLNLRYRLLPYIYSTAWQVTNSASTITRPLVMDFQNDPTAVGQRYEYMFGQSFLVAPVTAPGVKEVPVYLPKSADWYDFWTGKQFQGGQTIQAATPINQIPLFVKAGSIVPVGKPVQHTAEASMDTLQIRVYTGADAKFSLYSDEGDNYNYEQGQYKVVPFEWNEQKQTLTIGKKQGEHKRALQKQVFQVVWLDKVTAYGIDAPAKAHTVHYSGNKMTIKKN